MSFSPILGGGLSKIRQNLHGLFQVVRSEVKGPATIGRGTVLEGAFVGPYTSVGRECVIRDSRLERCVVLDGVRLEGVARLADSILGRNALVRGLAENHRPLSILIGDDAEVLV